jgi:8-oxo-dGTP pyrophosphatase MutT (NUDIX family)
MAGAHVFPGGRVDDEDHGADGSWCDGHEAASRAMPDVAPADALAFHVAAARELFEEVGVLLARASDRGIVSFTDTDVHARFDQHRSDIHDHRRSFRDVVTSEGLRLALDSVVYFAHWVTPPLDIRRFDTRFFLARVPEGQSPVHEEREATESTWVRPSDAIAGVAAGRFELPPPTWATLRELERFPDVSAALAWAAERTVRRREPHVIMDGDVRRITLPGDPSLPEPEPVAFETRFILQGGHWRPEA